MAATSCPTCKSTRTSRSRSCRARRSWWSRSRTPHQRDREKIADYARAGVSEYWIVDVISEVVVVHRDPDGDVYATVTEHRGAVLQPLLDAPPLALGALFGRA